MLLQGDGYLVHEARSGAEALALFEPGKFDMVFTDYLMPEMRGDQLAAAIKKRSPKQAVVMITAFPEKFQSFERPLGGVDSFICKPFELDTLRTAHRPVRSPPEVWTPPGHGFLASAKLPFLPKKAQHVLRGLLPAVICLPASANFRLEFFDERPAFTPGRQRRERANAGNVRTCLRRPATGSSLLTVKAGNFSRKCPRRP